METVDSLDTSTKKFYFFRRIPSAAAGDPDIYVCYFSTFLPLTHSHASLMWRRGGAMLVAAAELLSSGCAAFLSFFIIWLQWFPFCTFLLHETFYWITLKIRIRKLYFISILKCFWKKKTSTQSRY